MLRKLYTAVGIAAGIALVPLATYSPPGHGSQHSAGTQPTRAQDAWTAGVVRKIDKEAGKITIAHEPIANLEMPKMTMVFRAGDRALLEKLKPGERILFVAARVDGQLTVVEVRPAN